MFDVNKIRADFPILSQKMNGKPLIYFDNAATTQRPRQVIEKVSQVYSTLNANVHRGVYHLSVQATEAYEEARKTVADFIGAGSTREIVFTKGTTDSINALAFMFTQRYCKAGDEILISQMEHHSNIVPWQMAAERLGLKLKVIPMNEKGELLIDRLDALLTEKTKIVSVNHVSNALGTINPIEKIIVMAHAKGIPVAIDGAQAVAHMPVNVQQLDADFYAFSGHKIFGPTGVGVLYGKEKFLEEMPPYQGGGEMIDKVTFEKTTYNELPYKFEAGTPNFVGVIGLGEALKYVRQIGIENIENYEAELLHYATEQMMLIPNMRIFGTAENKSSVISFQVGHIHHFDLGTLLDQTGVAIRTGHHCAQPVMQFYKITGTARVSLSMYNTKEEIDQFIVNLKKVVAMLS